MSEMDPKPGTSKDSTSFMDFDDVEEGDDDHESNASIETPYKLDCITYQRYYYKARLLNKAGTFVDPICDMPLYFIFVNR